MHDKIEYWKSCITNRNDFPELVFVVLGGGKAFGSFKLDFFVTRIVIFEIEKTTHFSNSKHVCTFAQEASSLLRLV